MIFIRAIILSFCFVSIGIAGGSLSCPTSVTAGQSFNVQVTVSNDECYRSLTITDVLLTMIGTDAANAISVHGPYVTNISPAITISQASCVSSSGSFYTNITPTSIGPYSLQSTAPASMKGKLMLFSAAYLNSNNDNELNEIGNCKIIVR